MGRIEKDNTRTPSIVQWVRAAAREMGFSCKTSPRWKELSRRKRPNCTHLALVDLGRTVHRPINVLAVFSEVGERMLIFGIECEGHSREVSYRHHLID